MGFLLVYMHRNRLGGSI